MKSVAPTLTILLLLAMVSGQAGTPARNESLEGKILKASSLLLDSEKSADKFQGCLLLVESIDLAAADGGFPTEFRSEIRGALDIFRGGSILDPQGGDKLRKAYTLLNSGKPFQKPEEVSSIVQAVGYCRKQMGLALDKVKSGKSADAVAPLLKVILMVITPMERHGE